MNRDARIATKILLMINAGIMSIAGTGYVVYALDWKIALALWLLLWGNNISNRL